jgi:tRNA dimethylallyltransferase
VVPDNSSEKNVPLLVILGPTASGKTHLSVHVADRLDGEIISADSRQVYRGMTIGTGKDLAEFQLKGRSVPYHLIDIVDAGERYNVSRFQEDFAKASDNVIGRGKIPVICGGSGLYIEAVLQGYTFTGIPRNEALRQELELMPSTDLLKRFESGNSTFSSIADLSTRKRLIRAIEIGYHLSQDPNAKYTTRTSGPDYVCFGLDPAVELRRERISDRLAKRFDQGLIEEVVALMASGLSPEDLMYYGLEYKWVTMYLVGLLGETEMKKKLETEIHRFAKRQMTYYRKMEKDGIRIQWLDDRLTVQEMADQIVAHYINIKRSLNN